MQEQSLPNKEHAKILFEIIKQFSIIMDKYSKEVDIDITMNALTMFVGKYLCNKFMQDADKDTREYFLQGIEKAMIYIRRNE